jgi:hypothetical protein
MRIFPTNSLQALGFSALRSTLSILVSSFSETMCFSSPSLAQPNARERAEHYCQVGAAAEIQAGFVQQRHLLPLPRLPESGVRE